MVFRTLVDQMGFSISVPEHPQRIISLVPSQTELLYDLGLADRVIGITKFCVHPDHWRHEKKIVGGTKKFHIDEIEALKPDLIIGNKEENYEEGINTLKRTRPVWMSDIVMLDDAYAMMEALGRLTDTEEQARGMIESVKKSFSNLKITKRQTALYLIWKNPWMAVGKDTFIDAMMNVAGFDNVLDSLRYPEISDEEIAEMNPDVILLSSEPYPFKEKHIHDLKDISYSSKIKLVDGEIFSWYGSRMLKAADYFANLQSQL